MSALRGTAPGLLLGLLAALLAACGGGGGGGGIGGVGGSSGGGSSNVLAINVNLGPTGNYVNGIFTTVTLCVPATTTCQTINNILVDTGSYGLRILGSALNLTLPTQTTTIGATVGECTPYADGYTWGPVATADLLAAGETADNLPVAVFGQSSGFPSFPSAAPFACTQNGKEEDTLATFGANGVLGIGPIEFDCGSSCVTNATVGYYYACGTTTASCVGTTQTLARQVQNPVPLFASDNNGVIVSLPAVPDSGQQTAGGSLVFGIGTQSNNGLGSAQILSIDARGEFSTSYKGSTITHAFIDSGSNGLFFADSSIPQCSGSLSGFYCPGSTLSLSAQMIGRNNASAVVPFKVANTSQLNGGFAAFNDLAGTTSAGLNGDFDWGAPFLYGRNVYFAIQGLQTPGGAGPYYAF